MGKLNPRGAPKDGIADLRRRIEKLEAELKRQRSSSSFLQNATIGRGGLTVSGRGGVTVKDGGGMRLLDAQGSIIFEVVSDANNPDPDSNPQPTVLMYRADGSACLSMNDPIPTQDGYNQFLRIFDRAGTEIFAEDANSGAGLANPWLTGNAFPARYTDWPKSTSGTFETIYQGGMLAQNPTISLGMSHTSDAADTTGQARWQVNGTTVGDTVSIGFVLASTLAALQVPLPAGTPLRQYFTLTLQVRRTAGTGNVMAAPYIVNGSQSQ